jgi:manganese transport protein
MIALLLLTWRRDAMGDYVNSRAVTVLATTSVAAILALNLVLVLDSFDVVVV